MIEGKIGVTVSPRSTASGSGCKRVRLQAGDMLVVEPGERHTFIESAHDYLHFVVQAPFAPGDKASEPLSF